MIRLVKKWWLLRQLHKDCLGHDELRKTDFLLSGKWTSVARDAFVGWLANKSLKRFSRILRRRKKDNPKKLNRLVQEYNSMILSLAKEGYIEKRTLGEIKELKVKIEPMTERVFISTTPQGDDFLGVFPLLQKLLSEYYLAWTIIIIPLLLGAYGSPLVKDIVGRIIVNLINKI